jgi:asparagine synthetase B (glutamine-hydrolysing)
MCGIVGYITKGRGAFDNLYFRKLIRESRIRGLHAFGYSYSNSEAILTSKFQLSDAKTICMPIDAKALIFHNRYATSGDYTDERNNQPISLNGTSLVFNGVIDMGSKEDMEQRWGVSMETENDGELVLRLGEFDPKKMLKFVKKHGSFSGLVLQERNLFAMSNGLRPLWHWKTGKSVFIASTRDIFLRAIPESDPKELTINKLHVWST